MVPAFDLRLRALAEVVVRVGVNLQPGQRLLLTDPYELQGVHPETLPLAEQIGSLADAAADIIPADPARLRHLFESDDERAYIALVRSHTRRLQVHLDRGGAFLFLTGAAPGLFAGLPAERLARFDAIKWRHFGPIIQRLIRGASQWTLIPAPTTPWAAAIFPEIAGEQQTDALWQLLFDTFRVETSPDPTAPGKSAVAAWRTHLAALARRRDELNAARHRQVRYVGLHTDLTLKLPRSHRWCTAAQASTQGVEFVVNLPTEEIFTAPHQFGAEGRARIARPVRHAGAVIDGIQLEFVGGKVVGAHATEGQDALRELLRTDSGACRLGEVAVVSARNRLAQAGRFFHHTLFDENALSHIALGDAYRFCSRAWIPLAINSSQVHLDLPLEATVELS